MTWFVPAILFASSSVLIYKGAMQAHCRRMSLLLVERTITVLCLIALSVVLPGFQWEPAALWLGLAAGLILIGSRLCFLQLLRVGGATVGWTISSLAVAVPIVTSLTLWSEVPTGLQVAGLILAPPAVLLLRETGGPAGDHKSAGRLWIGMACLVFCFEGAFMTTFKIVDVVELGDSRHLFVLVLNVVALVAVTGYAGAAQRIPNRVELRWGVLSGACIVGAGVSWVNVLLHVPGIVFYPVASIAGIVLVASASRILFAERLTRIQFIGIVIAAAAILMILIR